MAPAGGIAGLLTERELALFGRMWGFERLLARARLLLSRGRFSDDLDRQRAILLRDVGKGRPGVAQRILVILAAASPATLERWRCRGDNSYLAQVGRLARHRDAGGDLLELAGSSPRVVELVRAGEPGRR